MLKQHVIADSDLHVMEPPDLWQRYIDPAFRHAAPVGLTMKPRGSRPFQSLAVGEPPRKKTPRPRSDVVSRGGL